MNYKSIKDTKFVILRFNLLIMAEITLKYDAKNPIALKTIDFIISLGVFKKVSGLDKALEEEKNGKIKKHKDSKDLFKNVLG